MIQPASSRWNPLRLVETLNFFGEVPGLGSVRWLQQWLGGEPNPMAPVISTENPQQVLGLGRLSDRAIAALNEAGIAMQPQPTVPEGTAVSNVGAFLWDGTTQLDSALAPWAAWISGLKASIDQAIFDFQAEESRDRLQAIWGAVDDVVMGGVSESQLALMADVARFQGNVSTANSGGFASVRTRNFEPPFDFQGWQGIRLQVKGDGQRYKLILRNSMGWDSPAYCASWDTEADRWMRVDIPFAAMQATFRARTQPTAPPLDVRRVCSFQLMLSKFEYDGEKNPTFRPGPFCLELRSLRVYRPVPTPPVIAIAATAAQAAACGEMLRSHALAHQVLDLSALSEAESWAPRLLSALAIS
ncbi:MAG: CIA30 family protein [Leptolyngbyaceae cyanobacterium T60_A2020_046]|nr:CIA30 family protein [Leptolyngbyaceae cyanobacterium T60_A2020_046]